MLGIGLLPEQQKIILILYYPSILKENTNVAITCNEVNTTRVFMYNDKYPTRIIPLIV
jgi:hypothetical protein